MGEVCSKGSAETQSMDAPRPSESRNVQKHYWVDTSKQFFGEKRDEEINAAAKDGIEKNPGWEFKGESREETKGEGTNIITTTHFKVYKLEQ